MFKIIVMFLTICLNGNLVAYAQRQNNNAEHDAIAQPAENIDELIDFANNMYMVNRDFVRTRQILLPLLDLDPTQEQVTHIHSILADTYYDEGSFQEANEQYDPEGSIWNIWVNYYLGELDFHHLDYQTAKAFYQQAANSSSIIRFAAQERINEIDQILAIQQS
ncbi:MAG: hypothetical protein P4L22_04615 [Candidatus Babeliales bacterium]|nr:hypothetical protein [Candidatus Babeliales bacterium]